MKIMALFHAQGGKKSKNTSWMYTSCREVKNSGKLVTKVKLVKAAVLCQVAVQLHVHMVSFLQSTFFTRAKHYCGLVVTSS